MRVASTLIALLASLASPALAQDHTQDHAFVLTGAGRFAVMADVASIRPDGDGVRMRAFEVAEPGFAVGDTPYWGGWSWWRFDCAAKTADRLDFASVREGGQEGPAMPDAAPAYHAAPGGDAAELLGAACSTTVQSSDIRTLEQAVAVGRTALAE